MDKVDVPKGDILIHSGDLTYRGTIQEMSEELHLLKEKGEGFKHIVFICGNHDWLGERNSDLLQQMCSDLDIIYLENSSVELEGYKIYGSPVSPFFCNWAFNVNRGVDIKAVWGKIPDDVEILVTHGPPWGVLDQISEEYNTHHLGCEELVERVTQLPKLKLHVFGHIHGSGTRTKEHNGTIFANASICTETYKPTNKPLVIYLK